MRRAAPTFKAIVEEKSASPAQKKIREINAGFYAFDVDQLFWEYRQTFSANCHAEYYLTDMASPAGESQKRVVATDDRRVSEVLGGNTRAEL